MPIPVNLADLIERFSGFRTLGKILCNQLESWNGVVPTAGRQEEICQLREISQPSGSI
jgi:hypothetical protein